VEGECRRVDRAEGLTAVEQEVQRLERVEQALFTLWSETSATSVRGVALRLRAWRYFTDPEDEELVAQDWTALAALADAERLAGLEVTPVSASLLIEEFAPRTIAEFGGVKS
jgi:hypothetical protein